MPLIELMIPEIINPPKINERPNSIQDIPKESLMVLGLFEYSDIIENCKLAITARYPYQGPYQGVPSFFPKIFTPIPIIKERITKIMFRFFVFFFKMIVVFLNKLNKS